MKCKNKTTKLLTVWLLIMFAVGFSMTGINEAISHSELRQKNPFSCSLTGESSTPLSQPVFSISEISILSQTDSEPLARLFQILFILFIISPPIMAFMLYLIWKELKKRNELK